MRTLKNNMITVLVAALLVSGISAESSQAKSVHSIKLKKKAFTLSIGDSKKIQLLDDSKKGVKRILKYKSNDVQVAKVNKKGKVTGVKAGKAKITAKLRLKNGQRKNLQCTVTVVEEEKKIDKSISTPIATYPVEPVTTVIPDETKPVAPSITEMPKFTKPAVPFTTPMPASTSGIVATIAPDEWITPTERPALSDGYTYESAFCSDIEVDMNGTKIATKVKNVNQLSPSIGIGTFSMKISSYEEWQEFLASSNNEPIMALYSEKYKDDTTTESNMEQSLDALDVYEPAFFEKNALLIGGYDFGRGYEFDVRSCVIDAQGKLTCNMNIENIVSADQMLTCDIVTYLTIIELDRENAERITEMEFIYKQWIPL